MTRPVAADPIAYPPRGMNKAEAARYVGVGTSLFDEMVASGRMPRAKRMSDGRVTWDRYALDAAYSELPENNVKLNSIDAAISGTA